MQLWRSFSGLIRVALTSADLYSSLQEINGSNIQIFDCQTIDELTAHFSILRRDYRKLRTLSEKRGETLSVLRTQGLYWSAKRALGRPVLLAGFLILTCIALLLPTRVLFIRVEGNTSIPSRLILAKAEDCGIAFGASRRDVRSERMKNALLEAIPQLQWAGVNTSGCVATITVEERTIPKDQSQPASSVSSIVAACDGVIRSCTVIRGNPLCTVGQAVKEGETLVSGYTDCGISIRATQAEAEIFADTSRVLTSVTPDLWSWRDDIQSETKKYSLIVGKKRINLYLGRGLSDGTCGKIYEQYQLTLPGGLELPVALVEETWITYDCSQRQISEKEAIAVLDRFSRNYLLKQMVAGQIMDTHFEYTQNVGSYTLSGRYFCTEMIGRVRNEETLENYGKTD